jgi:DNA-binding Lrp family transcriptional regulator
MSPIALLPGRDVNIFRAIQALWEAKPFYAVRIAQDTPTAWPLDDIDRQLITALATLPRAGMVAVARAAGVARATAQAHLDRLQERGVITGFGPDVDLRRVGYGVSAFVNLEIAQGRGPAVVAHLEAIPEVVEAYMTTGASDLLCRVVARDNDHLGHVLNDLLAVEGVARTTTSLVLATHIAPRVLPLITGAP